MSGMGFVYEWFPEDEFDPFVHDRPDDLGPSDADFDDFDVPGPHYPYEVVPDDLPIADLDVFARSQFDAVAGEFFDA